jgi:hypothetical protein
MALSAIGRKALLEHGRQKAVADRQKVSTAYVSGVVNGELLPKTRLGWKKYRRVQKELAKEIGMDWTEAFSAFERGEEPERQRLLA